MTKKYCTFAGWFLFAACILVTGAERGYGDDLYKASLTVSSKLSYSIEEIEAKISIKDNGKVELSIKGLETYVDNKSVTQSSVLVIETEVNEIAKTYSHSFTINDGKAEEEFTLDDLNKGDKLDILSVAVIKATSTTPTPAPTVTTSPTPTGTVAVTPTVIASPTPTGTATATPTVTVSPTPAGSSTAAFMVSATTTSDTILVPGGLISTSTTTTPSPTPVATASPTPSATVSPTGTPGIINATVEIKSETINLKGRGKFKAFITLPSPYSVTNINVDTVECEGAQAIDGKVDKNRFIATFRVQDLNFDIKFHKGIKDRKVKVTLDVTGELKDGTKFKGSDTVMIKGKKRGGDDDDDEDNGRHRK